MYYRRFIIVVTLLLCFVHGQNDAINLELLDTREGRSIVFEALVDVFQENYWDPEYTDWEAWADRYRARALEAEGRFRFEQVMYTMVNALHDDHSRWIGAQLPVQLTPTDDRNETADYPLAMGFTYYNAPDVGLIVLRVYADSPAEIAGLRRGDIIISIDGQDLQHKNLTSLQHILSPTVEARLLTVSRGYELLTLSVQAESLNLTSLEPLPTGYMLESEIGYFSLPSFYHPEVAQRSHNIIHDLKAQGATKLIIDMRGNTGGELGQLGLVLGIFLSNDNQPWAESFSRGSILWQASYVSDDNQATHSIKTPSGDVIGQSRLHTAPTNFMGDIVILINQDNSSAGEIMPLVLQHYGVATIVGDNTLGNTETIRLFNLPDKSTVLVAVSQLYIGGRIAGPVKVDYKSLESIEEMTRGFDAPLAEALRVLKGTAFTPRRYF